MLRLIGRHWRRRHELFYDKSRWHLILDLGLSVFVILLLAVVIGLLTYRPNPHWLKFWQMPPAVDLNNPPLEWSVTPATGILAAGGETPLKIKMKNKSSVSLDDIVIYILPADRDFSLDRLSVPSSGIGLKIENQAIRFMPLAAGETREADLSAFFSPRTDAARHLNWQAQLSYSVSGQTLKEVLSLPVLKLAGELKISAAAYYNSPQGDQLGIGPLPPVAGVPTTYWIFWQADSRGDFKNLVVSAKLPSGSELTGQRTLLAGEFSYNSDTRQVVWQVPILDKNNDNHAWAGFEVRLTPTVEQVGQVLPLLTKSQYYTQDTLTGAEITGSWPDLNTDLDFDRLNRGQGIVSAP